MTTESSINPDRAGAWLDRAFGFAVAAFVWWRISENTADNDLWGHVLYGQRMLHLHGLETTESLSWTAAGLPWINHEVFAELAFGLTHRLAGGSGLWLLMVGLATITLVWAWREGAGTNRPQKWVALGLLALMGNFIALGCAARPQLFTLLAFVFLLTALRRLLAGSKSWAFFPPLLLAVWINTHGGYLAGWLILLLALGLECLGAMFPTWRSRLRCEPTAISTGKMTFLAVASTVALLANPWGWQLVIWTSETVRMIRPHITEWHPMVLSFANLPFYITIGLGIFAWLASRRRLRLWEFPVWILLAIMAITHQRHAPLFGLATVMLLPVHVLDLLTRLAPATANLRHVLNRPAVRTSLTLLLIVAGGWCGLASISAPRAHPFRMEIPRDLYPVAAIDFIRAHGLTGNTLTFFDWGQQVLWELPDNPVSFDGRLDTVYPATIMDAHWQLYEGRQPGAALDLSRAKVAILPTGGGGVDLLLNRGWKIRYVDALATVLDHSANPSPPVLGGVAATLGRVSFPDNRPVLANRLPTLTP